MNLWPSSLLSFSLGYLTIWIWPREPVFSVLLSPFCMFLLTKMQTTTVPELDTLAASDGDESSRKTNRTGSFGWLWCVFPKNSTGPPPCAIHQILNHLSSGFDVILGLGIYVHANSLVTYFEYSMWCIFYSVFTFANSLGIVQLRFLLFSSRLPHDGHDRFF